MVTIIFSPNVLMFQIRVLPYWRETRKDWLFDDKSQLKPSRVNLKRDFMTPPRGRNSNGYRQAEKISKLKISSIIHSPSFSDSASNPSIPTH